MLAVCFFFVPKFQHFALQPESLEDRNQFFLSFGEKWQESQGFSDVGNSQREGRRGRIPVMAEREGAG